MPRLLARIAAGALWIAALTAALLPIERLIEPDRADGVLDQLADPRPHRGERRRRQDRRALADLRAAAAARRAARLVPPRRSIGTSLGRALVALAVGTPGLAALAVMVAALTAGLPRAGALAGVLLLPLAVPLLIFGAGAAGDAGRRAAARSCRVLAAGCRLAVRHRRGDPSRLGLRPARENRGGQQQSARFLAHRHLADLDRAAKVAETSVSPARRSPAPTCAPHRRSARGTGCLVEQPAAIGEQRREILLQPPHLACRARGRTWAGRAGCRRSAARAGLRAR